MPDPNDLREEADAAEQGGADKAEDLRDAADKAEEAQEDAERAREEE